MSRRLIPALFALSVLCSPALATQSTLVTPGPPLPMTSLATFLNNAFLTIAGCSSGAVAPAPVSAAPITYQCWVDTTTNPRVMKIYDGTSWISTGTINTSTHTYGVTAASAALSPIANTTNQALTITQTSPTTGGGAGPLKFNSVAVNNQYATTTGTDSVGLQTGYAAALDVRMTEGGSNVTGFQTAAYLRLDHNVGASNITFADHIGAIVIATSNQNANGHGIYALNPVVWLTSGANHSNVVGAEFEVGIFSGATAPTNRTGVRLHSYGDVQGSSVDAAITVIGGASGAGNAAWKSFVTFSEIDNAQSIETTGDLFNSFQSMTVANVFSMANLTVTGNILNFPHAKLTGAGVLTLNPSANASPTPITGTLLHLANSGNANIMLDAAGVGASGAIASRMSRGTLAVPTATQSADLIGGLAFQGYGASAYSGTRAAVFGYAAENWTNSAQGAYVDVFTTPTGSSTAAIAARFSPLGGIQVGGAGEPGAGSIGASGLIAANGLLGSGGVGVGTGRLVLAGNTSGSVNQTVQAAAGTPTVTWGTSTGTPVVTATSPLSITTATGNLTISGAALTKADDTNVTLTLGGTPTTALINAASITAGWTGTLSVARGGTGDAGTAWTTYTPTMTWGSGSPTAHTPSGSYKIIGKTVFVKLRLVLTTANTATGSFTFSLPFTLVETNQVINGVEYQLNGKMMRGIATTTTAIQCKYYDNAWVPVDGERYVFEGVFELA